MINNTSLRFSGRLFVFSVLFSFAQIGFCGVYGGGAGTADDPFLIGTAEHMQEIGANEEDWDKCFKLMADIDLGGYEGEEFNIIGIYGNYPGLSQFLGIL